MKNFREAVKRNYQEEYGTVHVFPLMKNTIPLKREPIDLIAIDRHGEVTFIRAREGGHDNPNRMTQLRLQVLGKKCAASKVLHAKENGENKIVFKIIYGEKGEKTKNGIQKIKKPAKDSLVLAEKCTRL